LKDIQALPPEYLQYIQKIVTQLLQNSTEEEEVDWEELTREIYSRRQENNTRMVKNTENLSS
jgi:TRAP-type C4-dicarboxylate transport system substrate-binding protein